MACRKFYTKVENNGAIKTTDATVRFKRGLINNGAYLSDPSSNYFTNLTINGDGYLKGGQDDLFFVSEDFVNASLQYDKWDTSNASLIFNGWGNRPLTLAMS